ncbi:hypothetical protein L1987_31917 [Smallanthus sonchifolius]|uniref:Uncharacterized protein n=1 Tax=Smallanthus sonchifolius TaxID=185202 RepID=A0ACB9I8B9_9ASTR|nr:hypothetical protein L1987_31917 [Smallanthus sonchifolius]
MSNSNQPQPPVAAPPQGSFNSFIAFYLISFLLDSIAKDFEFIIVRLTNKIKDQPLIAIGYPEEGHAKGIYPPPEGYGPPGGYPPQGYPTPGYPPQGYPPQGYPPHGYPQGYPPHGYPPQGYQSHGYPPQPHYTLHYVPPQQHKPDNSFMEGCLVQDRDPKSIKAVQFCFITASLNKHELFLPNSTDVEASEDHSFITDLSTHQFINKRFLLW